MFDVKRAGPEDVAPALELALRVYMEFEAPDYGPQAVQAFKTGFIESKPLAEKYRDGSFAMFCAFDGERIVGMIAERGRGHICMVFVDRDYHRLGIATSMMDAMIAYQREKGFERVTLNAAPFGLPFYLHYGFRRAAPTREDDGITYTPVCYGERFKYLLFDLDGTVTDPAEGITNSVAYSLEKFGIHVEDKRNLYTFIGPPLWDSYMRYFGFTREQAEQAVEYYREYYRDRGIYECKLYDGVVELLSKLKSECKVCILATSKPTVFALRVLEHFGLSDCFDFVSGSELDGTRVEKADVIEYALAQRGITERSRVLMIGDRKHDIIGANKAAVKSAGVLWGYGDAKELHDEGADYLLNNFTELEKVALS